jgi:hypothetical protein
VAIFGGFWPLNLSVESLVLREIVPGFAFASFLFIGRPAFTGFVRLIVYPGTGRFAVYSSQIPAGGTRDPREAAPVPVLLFES